MKMSILLLIAAPLTLVGASAESAQVPRKLTNIENAYPSFSPDGRQIVFNREREETADIYGVDLDE